MTRFTWHDGERTIVFGRDASAHAAEHAGEGFTLLTTERNSGHLSGLQERAADLHYIGEGPVDRMAEALLPAIHERPLVAFGGGRVIDTAKALGAVLGTDVTAIPTTLSGAEMTHLHRLPASAPPGTRTIRPRIVVNDPALSASQPLPELAASASNALAHAIEGRVTIHSSPVPAIVAEEAARLIDIAFYGDDPAATDRDKLALGALLAGYVADASGIGLHHMLSQTLVRVCGARHGAANAAMLPHTIAALERRYPGRVDPDGTLTELARKLGQRAGASRLRDIGVDEGALDEAAMAASELKGLDNTPPRAEFRELRELYAKAW